MKKLTTEKCREFISVFKSLEKEGHLALTSAYHLQALQIALPILEQQEMITDSQPVITDSERMITDSDERGDGWIEWGGGECPVDIGTLVEFEMRDGDKDTALSTVIDWPHENRSDDIIAYRIIPEQPTNQNGEQ